MLRSRSGSPDSDLLERDRELGVIDDLIQGALEGRRSLALVEGPAGIGKSRLLAATRAAAQDAGFRVLAARGSDLERELPFGIVRQLFDPLLIDPDDRARWLAVRDTIYEEVMHKGWDPQHRAFVQAYGAPALDASNLLMPLVFFTAPNDPRMLATVDAIRKPLAQGGLSAGGLVYRYDPRQAPDGLPGTEGTFNMCSF